MRQGLYSAAVAAWVCSAAFAGAQETVGVNSLAPELKAKVSAAVEQVLAKTGVPSAQVGIVQGGRVVYTAGYGKARLEPVLAAAPSMHYPVGSISKQFTAACVMLLVEDGKMKLDDPVARWFPELTRSKDITVRMLMSHTSGYSDYAPQDYTIPAWTRPVDPLTLVREWAGKPLDFEPGSKWQYSNTNFVLTGLIVEKVSGQPFWKFVTQRVLQPAGMHDVLNLDTDRDRVEATGYMRYALAPLRPATPEAPGWYFADGEMAMPVGDLLVWDQAVMGQKILKPDSWRVFEQSVKLKDGSDSGYGLGVDVRVESGHRVIAHSGEVGGFVAQNTVFPDDRIAIAVLTNQEASGAATAVARALTPLLLAGDDPKPGSAQAESQIRSMLSGLANGQLDRSALTPDLSAYFSPVALSDFATSLTPLGAITEVKQVHQALRGGMTFRAFDVAFAGGQRVRVTTYAMADGKLEQFLVETLG